MNFQDIPLKDNIESQSFELWVEGQRAFIDYSAEGENVILIHTEVPVKLEGQGLASVLVEKVFKHLEQEGKRIIPSCSYVRAYLRKHPEWNRILA